MLVVIFNIFAPSFDLEAETMTETSLVYYLIHVSKRKKLKMMHLIHEESSF